MFGLIVFGLLGIYLMLLAWAARRGWRWGVEKKGWTGRKRYLGAAIGFLIVYLPVFWDFIPTVATHQYYCAKDSGFWVYKTLDQWKVENPWVMEGLVEDKNGPFTRVGDDKNHTDTKILNQRFHWANEKHQATFFLPIYRWKFEVVDSKSGDVLARQIYFSSGEGRDYLKFWMNINSCSNSHTESIKSSEFTNQFKGAKK